MTEEINPFRKSFILDKRFVELFKDQLEGRIPLLTEHEGLMIGVLGDLYYQSKIEIPSSIIDSYLVRREE